MNKYIYIYVGLKGNEVADKLAKEALDSPVVQHALPPGMNEVHEQIDVYINQLWQEHWDSCTTGRLTWVIQPLVNNKIKFQNSNRKKEVVVSRLRLGKCWLNKCLHNIKCHQTGKCAGCDQDETVEHFLLHCSQNGINEKIRDYCVKNKTFFNIFEVLNSADIIKVFYPLINRDL